MTVKKLSLASILSLPFTVNVLGTKNDARESWLAAIFGLTFFNKLKVAFMCYIVQWYVHAIADDNGLYYKLCHERNHCVAMALIIIMLDHAND